MTIAAARVGAVLEAFETWCAARHLVPTLAATVASARESYPLAAIDLLLGFDAIEAECRNHEGIESRWVCALNLGTLETLLVPYESVHLDFRVPMAPGDGVWLCSTIGLASGNTLAEAVLHGLLEVVEHHSEASWLDLDLGQRRLTRIDVSSLRGLAVTLVERLAERGVSCALWDQTSADCGITSAFAGIVEADPSRDWHTLPLATGTGAHLDEHVAAYRALIEAVQSRATYITGARDDLFDDDYLHIFDSTHLAGALAEIAEPSYVRFTSSSVVVSAQEQLVEVLHRLAVRGWNEILAVDLTPRDSPFCVARVIVPGMRTASE